MISATTLTEKLFQIGGDYVSGEFADIENV